MQNIEFKLFKLSFLSLDLSPSSLMISLNFHWTLWSPLVSHRAAICGRRIRKQVFEPFHTCAYLNSDSVFYGRRLILHHFITLTTLCSPVACGYQISLSAEYFMTQCRPQAQRRLICRHCSLMLAFALNMAGILRFCHCYYLIGSNGHVKYSF